MPKRIRNKEQNKQLAIILGFLILVLGGFLASYFYFQNQNYFSYAGQNFTRIKEGKVTFYHTKFPIIYKGEPYSIFNVYLRIDPRKNEIPIKTNFSISKEVIISFDEALLKCEDLTIAQAHLSLFLSMFPWVKDIKPALTDKDAALRNQMDFADCSYQNEDRTIILVKESKKSSIEKEGENCYTFNVANCQYVNVVERYIIGVIAQINKKEI